MIRVNGEEHAAVYDSVTNLIEQLAIEPRGIAVAVNGEVVRRTDWSNTTLHEGDQVEIVSAAAGG